MYTMAIFILDADNPIPCVDLEEPGLAPGMGMKRLTLLPRHACAEIDRVVTDKLEKMATLCSVDSLH